jgi:hypothetical protein
MANYSPYRHYASLEEAATATATATATAISTTETPRQTVPANSQSLRDLGATLTRQALARHDLTSMIHSPRTRGLLPKLPALLAPRVVANVNGMYAAHVPLHEVGVFCAFTALYLGV